LQFGNERSIKNLLRAYRSPEHRPRRITNRNTNIIVSGAGTPIRFGNGGGRFRTRRVPSPVSYNLRFPRPVLHGRDLGSNQNDFQRFTTP